MNLQVGVCMFSLCLLPPAHFGLIYDSKLAACVTASVNVCLSMVALQQTGNLYQGVLCITLWDRFQLSATLSWTNRRKWTV